MGDQNNASMKEQRTRRRRVARIRNGIMMTVGIWMLLSMVCCIALTVQVIRLDHKMDEMAMNAITVQQMEDMTDHKGAAKEDDIQPYSLTEGQEDGMDEAQAGGDEAGDEAEELASVPQDNMVQENVRQKVYLTFDDGPSEITVRCMKC